MIVRLPHKATRWAILGAISYVLCFPRFDLPILGILFLPCLIFSVQSLDGWKRAWKLGLLVSTMIAWGGFHWIIYVAQNFGEMPWSLAIGLLCLYCLVASPQVLLFFLFGERVRYTVETLPLCLRPLFWACLYTALEFFTHFYRIFPEHLGNTWIAYLSIAQVASLGGVSLLSFLPLWAGASLAYLRKNGRCAWPSVAASLLAILLSQAWGAQQRAVMAQAPVEILRVGFVQHNLDDAEKQFQRTSARAMVEMLVTKLLTKTRELSTKDPKPDLILWPETAYPIVFTTAFASGFFSYEYANLVRRTVAAGRVPLLFGGYETENKLDYNSAILIQANGTLSGSYRKQVLLMFGEYFPFSNWLPALKRLNPMLGDFGRGPGPVPLRFRWKGADLLLGANICYEAILPEYMRGFAKNGARLFVNMTKDSWFGNTFEPWQHLQLSALRSIEHRIPMVRATNTGLSGLVLPTGEMKLLSAPFEEAYTVLEVPLALQPEPSLYTILGDWFAWACLLTALGLGAYSYRRRA